MPIVFIVLFVEEMARLLLICEKGRSVVKLPLRSFLSNLIRVKYVETKSLIFFVNISVFSLLRRFSGGFHQDACRLKLIQRVVICGLIKT